MLATHLLIILVAILGAAFGDDVILKPIKTAGEEISFIMIQGAQIKPDQYVPLAKAIQAAVDRPLWIGIPEFLGDIAEPLVLSRGISNILKSMVSQGMKSDVKTFFGGHSLGGAVLQDYVESNANSVAGQILMGSFLLRKQRSSTYPVATLTIGGELDGLCRVSRIMEEYHERIGLAPSRQVAISTFPVLVVKGMNHFHFASGSMPLLVRERDLKAEISFDEAHTTVAMYISAFISVHLGNTSSLALIDKGVSSTGGFLQPLLTAYLLEASYHFKPPCYDNPPSSACVVGSPWTPTAVSMVAGLKEGAVNDSDEFHPVTQIPFHLPHVLNNCSKPSNSCLLQSQSVSDNIYEEGDKLDTGFFSNSAVEIRAKIKSRQVFWEAAGYGKVDFNKTDSSSLCADVNCESYNWALKNAGPDTLSRFIHYGVPMVMVKDRGPYNAGPLWIYNSLKYTKATNSTGGAIIEVSSAILCTPDHYYVKAAAGMHYCKLLSPARVMEWMYVDGLREHYSVNNSTLHV
jgi:hypothetical protein